MKEVCYYINIYIIIIISVLAVPEPIPEPPVVNETTISPTTAVLTWDVPIPNGVIISYTVGLVGLSTVNGSTSNSGTGRRRRRKRDTLIVSCVGENRNITVGGDQTSLEVTDLSQLKPIIYVVNYTSGLMFMDHSLPELTPSLL